MNFISITALDKKAEAYVDEIQSQAERLVLLLGMQDKEIEIFLTTEGIARKKIDGEKKEFNVLSFPADTDVPRPDLTQPSLGEIYLNPAYIKEHDEDLLLMLVHGVLHLLRYDHQTERDRIVMEKKEEELLQQLRAKD